MIRSSFAAAAVVLTLTASPALALPVYVDNSGGSADFTLPDSYDCAPDGTCNELRVSVRDARNHEVWFQDGSTLDAGQSLGDGTYAYQWECAHAGRLHWSAAELDQDAQVIDSATGSFTVPRCKPSLWWHVGYSAAAGRAAQLAPGDEFVDHIECIKGAGARRASAGEWRCAVTSNTVYRVCDRYFALDFVLRPTRGGYGPYAHRWSASVIHRPTCRAF